MTTPSSVNKQPHEKYPAAFDYTGKMPSGATLASAQVQARRATSIASTTLSATATAADATVSVAVNPRKGAKLVIEPGTTNEETCVVTAVSGSGPYVCTLLQAVQETHASGAAVNIHQGATDTLLTTTTAAISGAKATAIVRGGLNGLTYQVTCYATLSDGTLLEDDLSVVMTDA